MRMVLTTLAMSAAFVATDASRSNRSHRPLSMRGAAACRARRRDAFITQHRWDLNLVNDAGEPSRGWIDYPGHLWVQDANQGAIYSVDGLTIQFDRGTIWRRAIDEPLPGRRRR